MNSEIAGGGTYLYCVPEHMIPWVTIVVGLLLLLIAGWQAGEWFSRYTVREAAGRRARTVRTQRHMHDFPIKRWVNGVAIGECSCGATKIHKEPPP